MHPLTEKIKYKVNPGSQDYVDQEIIMWLDEKVVDVGKGIPFDMYRESWVRKVLCLDQPEKRCKHMVITDTKSWVYCIDPQEWKFCPICGKERPQ